MSLCVPKEFISTSILNIGYCSSSFEVRLNDCGAATTFSIRRQVVIISTRRLPEQPFVSVRFQPLGYGLCTESPVWSVRPDAV